MNKFVEQFVEQRNTSEIFAGQFVEQTFPFVEQITKSQRIINESLFQLTPEIPILSEEGSKLIEKEQKEFWLVDPLDGTKEFINKNGEFTVNIALVRENEVKLGVVFAPEKNELFCLQTNYL